MLKKSLKCMSFTHIHSFLSRAWGAQSLGLTTQLGFILQAWGSWPWARTCVGTSRANLQASRVDVVGTWLSWVSASLWASSGVPNTIDCRKQGQAVRHILPVFSRSGAYEGGTRLASRILIPLVSACLFLWGTCRTKPLTSLSLLSRPSPCTWDGGCNS